MPGQSEGSIRGSTEWAISDEWKDIRDKDFFTVTIFIIQLIQLDIYSSALNLSFFQFVQSQVIKGFEIMNQNQFEIFTPIWQSFGIV